MGLIQEKWYCMECDAFHRKENSIFAEEFLFNENSHILYRGQYVYCPYNPNADGVFDNFAPSSKYIEVYGEDEWAPYLATPEERAIHLLELKNKHPRSVVGITE